MEQEIVRDNFSIRKLQESEALLYKSIRLEGLLAEPALFRPSTPPEVDLTDEEWKKKITPPRFVFGLFCDGALIGMTSFLLTNEDEAYLGQSYIKKEFRGLGLSSLLYDIRFSWAHKLGLKRLTISHKASNTISRSATQKAGFVYSHTETITWLDGTTGDSLLYALDLQQ